MDTTQGAQKTKLELAIEGASTKQLQAIYASYWGRPTSNRNAQALRARILKHAGVLADIEAQRADLARQRAQAGRVSQKLQGRASSIAEYEQAEARGAASARAMTKRKRGGEGGGAPAAPGKSARRETIAQVAETRKPLRTKLAAAMGLPEKYIARTADALERAVAKGNTKSTLAGLSAGIWLVHAFKDGREPTRVYVNTAMTADGKGGVFEWAPPGTRGKFEQFVGLAGLREIVRRSSGHAWNVLLYFRREDTGELLKPYPVHRDRLEKRAARKSDALTDAERELDARDVELRANAIDLATPTGRAAVKRWAGVTMWAVKKGAAHGDTRRRPATRDAGELRKLFADCPVAFDELSTEQRERAYDLYKKSFDNAKVLEAAAG